VTNDDLAAIHVKAIERYTEIFEPIPAECQALCWWRWAARTLNRQLYEEVRKRRWEHAGKLERMVAKSGVPSK